MSVVGLAVLFVSLVPGGGLSWGASNLVWIILVPMAAVLFLGARAAAPALGAVVVLVVAAAVIDPMLRAVRPDPLEVKGVGLVRSYLLDPGSAVVGAAAR
jgi:hypothetical protein